MRAHEKPDERNLQPVNGLNAVCRECQVPMREDATMQTLTRISKDTSAAEVPARRSASGNLTGEPDKNCLDEVSSSDFANERGDERSSDE
jgi:hypothetical protein